MNYRHGMCVVIATGLILALSGCGKSASDQAGPKAGAGIDQPAAAQTGTDAAQRKLANASSQQVRATVLDATALDSARPTKGLRCYLDMVDGKRSKSGFYVGRGTQALFVGWVLDSHKAAPSAFTLVLDGAQSYGLPGHTGGVRPDVAKAVGSEKATTSGFAVYSALGGVVPGTYEVMTMVASPEGDELCDLHRKIHVGN